MLDYSHEEKLEARDRIILEKHELATQFVDLLEPAYYLPFAGEYVLAGDLATLNQYTANPPRIEAYEWFERNVPDDHECVFLNSGEHIDLATGRVSEPFEPIDQETKQAYIETVLAERSLTYEDAPLPEREELYDRLPAAYENFEANRQSGGFETDTTVLVSLLDDEYVELAFDGEGYQLV
jgi:UDP-MurNAc hydroxylase